MLRPAYQVVPADLLGAELEPPVRPAPLALEARAVGLAEPQRGAARS
jgi:hypothetical protein